MRASIITSLYVNSESPAISQHWCSSFYSRQQCRAPCRACHEFYAEVSTADNELADPDINVIPADNTPSIGSQPCTDTSVKLSNHIMLKVIIESSLFWNTSDQLIAGHWALPEWCSLRG